MGTLVLRDVHEPPAPPLWPLAPGWWMLAVVLLLAGVIWLAYARGRRRRRAQAARVFDEALAAADDPASRIAAASELLRRAARRVRPDADRLQADDWLRFLDSRAARFSDGPGRLLLDGPFRADVPPAQADEVVALARARFAELMGAR